MNEPGHTSTDARYGTHMEAARPYFEIIETALDGLVDGETYFDFLADDFIFEFPFALPAWPAKIEGRAAVIAYFEGYGERFQLDRVDGLVTHLSQHPGVVILEYESHGHAVPTGRPYNNHYLSIIYIEDRRIVRWRDYWSPVEVLTALGGTITMT
jgi:uncharacterized protein